MKICRILWLSILLHSVCLASPPLEETPPNKRFWDGNNPFHQPAATTNYYGSGDVNNDGELTIVDVDLALQMAQGLASPTFRADVDGNGLVDEGDVSLISAALDGGTLPAWWNMLSGPAERSSWIIRLLALDQLDKHTYDRDWFVCIHFATQLFIRSAFHRFDLSKTNFDGGTTVFNIPMYIVATWGFGHVSNAILVGDDPLNIGDWLFIEPITDATFQIDYMPPGSEMHIMIPMSNTPDISFFTKKLIFVRDETGWTVSLKSPDLILERPAPPPMTPDNRPDLWKPRIVPLDHGMVLYESTRDDLRPTTDIYLAEMPFVDPPRGTPLILDPEYSRLLDVAVGSDEVYLLWTGKPEYIPGVYLGRLDPETRNIHDIVKVSQGLRPGVLMGRLIVRSEGDIHVFWAEDNWADDPYPTGVYWRRWTDAKWDSEQLLTPDTTLSSTSSRYRHLFDVANTSNDELLLVWSTINGLCYRLYDGLWGAPNGPDGGGGHGVDLGVDSDGTLHMAYWDRRSSGISTSLGNLYHQIYDGMKWSVTNVLDPSEKAGYPRMAAGSGGSMYLVWVREDHGRIVPVWNTYVDGEWGDSNMIITSSGADAGFPTLAVVPGGVPVFAWMSSSEDHVTIETCTVYDLNNDGSMDASDLLLLANAITENLEFLPGTHVWGDINADARVNILDLLLLHRTLLENS